jgi:hypothetical protein
MVTLMIGCQSPHQPPQPPPMSLTVDKGDFDIAWDETVDVLREYNFVPDRQDRRAGIIVTLPTLSKQLFEFWRTDAQGNYDLWESSLHNIRRLVEVRFIPKNGKYEIRMIVRVERKHQPQRMVTTSSGVFQAFRESIPTFQGEAGEKSQSITWETMGKDIRFSNYLLTRIQKRLYDSELEQVERFEDIPSGKKSDS